MSDSLTDSRKIGLFNVIDDFNPQSLCTEADTSLPSLRVIRVLEVLIAQRGKPARLTDNGPEFIAEKLVRRSWHCSASYPAGSADAACLYRKKERINEKRTVECLFI